MNTRKITNIGLFIALAIVLPQGLHLIFPGLGPVLLPMHIPAIIGGMILGPLSGMIIGMLSVLIGFVLGMPPLPIAYFMFIEISVYGLIAGYLVFNKKINIYLALVVAMLFGRLASLVSMNMAISLMGMKLPKVFGTIAMYTSGVPGIVVQLLVIPPVVYALRRYLNGTTIR